jgi:oxamate amidohydrolase
VTSSRSTAGSWGVAAPHRAATDAAAAVLAAGGTAVDGAIAAAGVLAVVYPHNCSLGGDLIGLVRTAGGLPQAVFGVGRSAAATDADALRQRFGERVPVEGAFSISVPGVVSGWQALHRLGGSLPLERLLEPAVALAARGAAVSLSLARALQALDSPDPGLAQIFGPPGRRLGAGDLFVQPQLAETLAQVAADPECYYRGDLAERLVAGLASVGSPITLEDFIGHQAIVEGAEEAEAGDLSPRLFTAGLPSQGVFLAALVELVGRLFTDGYDLLGRDAALLAGAFGAISKIRDDLLCDPSRLPDRASLRERLAEIDVSQGLPSTGRLERSTGAPSAPPSGDTVAVVAYDETGNSVSMLQSVFHSFGSRFLDPGSGVLFHNRQSMFTLRHGALGELGPGLMPPHTLSPAMVDASNGAPSLVLATMGGRAQPQILAQVLLQLASGKGVSEAVSAPRFFVGDTDVPAPHLVVTAELDSPAGTLSALAEGGFDVRTVPPLNDEVGHAQVLRIGAAGIVDAAADPRSDGAAIYRDDLRRR